MIDLALAFFLAIVLLGIFVVYRLSDPPPRGAAPLPAGTTQEQIEQLVVGALYQAAAHAKDPSIRLSVQTHAAELGGRYPLQSAKSFLRWRQGVEACARGFRWGTGRKNIERALALAVHLEDVLVKGAAR